MADSAPAIALRRGAAYESPHEMQNEMDGFWLDRAQAATELRSKLPHVEEAFTDAWKIA